MMMATYMAEQKSQGKYENLVELVRGWNKRHSKIAAKDMAESIMVTLPTFNSVLSIIKEHPDWDDEQVVDEVDWELLDD